MAQYILVGCDVHDRTIVAMVAEDRGIPDRRTVVNTQEGRLELIRYAEARAGSGGGAKIVFAYEASIHGFGFYDEVKEAGHHCSVLAPHRIRRSSKDRKRKSDPDDARQILEVLRGHFLAGNELPEVWVPDGETRADRILVRGRIDAREKQSAVRSQIKCLLKQCNVCKPRSAGPSWTREYMKWVESLTFEHSRLDPSVRRALESLLRQEAFLGKEVLTLETQVARLSEEEWYAEAVK